MNCKPGDLAIVIRSPTFKENVGKMVRCISINDHFVDPKNGAVWNVDRELTWFRYSTAGPATLCCAPDSVLMPIRGEPDPEGEYTERPESVTIDGVKFYFDP